MKKILIIGTRTGIGNALLHQLNEEYFCFGINRQKSDINLANYKEYNLDVLTEDLPEIDDLQGIVYCPGSIILKPFHRIKKEEFIDDIELNVMGAVKVLQKYYPSLKNNSASVVLFSSVATSLGMPFHASVAISKSALEGLTKTLAAEWAPNIRVNIISPTLTDTPLAEKLLKDDASKERMKERHPLKKYLLPLEVAQTVKFLLSDDSSSMTGQNMKLDCGIVSVKL